MIPTSHHNLQPLSKTLLRTKRLRSVTMTRGTVEIHGTLKQMILSVEAANLIRSRALHTTLQLHL
jgi:hypothetical protein